MSTIPDPVPAAPAGGPTQLPKPPVDPPQVEWRCPVCQHVIPHRIDQIPETTIDAHIASHPRGAL